MNDLNFDLKNFVISEFMDHDNRKGARPNYHQDWNHLMPVLQSINDNAEYLAEDSNNLGDITHGLLDLDIEQTHDAAYRAILEITEGASI